MSGNSSFENKMLFGSNDGYSNEPWSRKRTPISDQKFKEEHMERFRARQKHLMEMSEKEKKHATFPASRTPSPPAAKFGVTPQSVLVVKSKPLYFTKMTDADAAGMANAEQAFTLKQIQTFFEGKIDKKVCFEGIPIRVVNVFLRSDCVAVEFAIKTSDMAELVLNRSVNNANGREPYAVVDIDDSGPVHLVGRIQGAFTDKMKVLFR